MSPLSIDPLCDKTLNPDPLLLPLERNYAGQFFVFIMAVRFYLLSKPPECSEDYGDLKSLINAQFKKHGLLII